MKMQLFVAASAWDRENLSIELKKSANEYNVPLGAFTVDVPDDLIPSQELFEAMKRSHAIECKERELRKMREDVADAERELAELKALPSQKSVLFNN